MENKKTIIENNVKICLFMGGVEIAPVHYFIEERKTYFLLDEMKYHESWDWLMPVVEKIEATHDDFHGYFGVYISSNYCTIQGTNLRTEPDNPHYAYFNECYGKNKLQAVYIAVCNFINWHNSQNTKEQ